MSDEALEYGARVLEKSVDALLQIYEITMNVLQESISAAKANPSIGLIGMLAFIDLLHGGAYTAPVNQRPNSAPDPTKSPYYAGQLRNEYALGLGGVFAQFFAGQNAAALANEVLENANVPHVFPKIISDEAYAMIRLLFAQAATTGLFEKVSTGLSVLVEKGAEAGGALAPLLKTLTPK